MIQQRADSVQRITRRIGFLIVAIAIVVVRNKVNLAFGWGVGVESANLVKVVATEVLSLVGLTMVVVAWLRLSTWPSWVLILPVVLLTLSTPLWLQLGDFWAEQGFAVHRIVSFCTYAMLALVAVLIAYSLAPIKAGVGETTAACGGVRNK